MHIAIVGAGPVGLHAAIEAENAGHTVTVYDAGRVGEHLLRWGHVKMFTPWHMNTTEAARSRISCDIDPGHPPTGAQFVDAYLRPLAATLNVQTHTRVEHIGRTTRRKSDALGRPERAEDPFVLLLQTGEGERFAFADVVLDCSGVFGDPAPAGINGLCVIGERGATRRVHHGPVDVRKLSGERFVVVGDGASGVTVVRDVLDNIQGAEVCWITKSEVVPGFTSPEDDPLPERRELHERGVAAARDPRVNHLFGAGIVAIEETKERLSYVLNSGETRVADHAIICTGFRPDHSLSRELQFHVCWGTEGPMKLAASLLASSGAGGDCLAAPAQGPEALVSPEPGFFVLGNKSYGRRSDFLLRNGYAQAKDVMQMISEA